MSSNKVDTILKVIGSYRNDSDSVITPSEVSQYIQSIKFLEDILNFSKTCFFIVEYTNISYLYCSPNVSDMLGHTADDYMKGGPLFSLAKVSIEDLALHKLAHERIIKEFTRTPEEEKSKTKFSFTLRLENKDGQVRQILQNNFFLKWSEDGKPLLKLFTLTDITAYKKTSDFIFFTSRLLDDGTQQMLTQENLSSRTSLTLSARELEVLKLAAKGHSNKAISAMTSLNENTVKNHKKNITKKLGTKNLAEAISLAAYYGFAPFAAPPIANALANLAG
jgi:DNA-binding CsgD family transcriptional regulator